MKRSVSVFAGVLLLSAGVASGRGQGEVVSYYMNSSAQAYVVGTAPPEGFVLTDIVAHSTSATSTFSLCENTQGSCVTPRFNSRDVGREYQFNSGVTFSGGPILISWQFAGGSYVTLTGYIPGTPAGPVPTVSQWGLVVMVMLILIAATTIFARRRVTMA